MADDVGDELGLAKTATPPISAPTGDDETLAGTTVPTAPETQVGRGDAIGRYVVLSRLGQGGMGIVYEAYDPELNRKLAIKLLHPLRRKKSEEKAAEQRMRLLREAQAMARLTHPNVITVHDVGPYEDGVFVAMEFVDGSTLGEWLETERPWPEVLAVFNKAANGLAAAHRADLIHRDFKPENVMVASDGRVLVMDFGLALEPWVVVDRNALRLQRRLDPALRLLHQMPTLMGQMPLLPRRDVNILPLRVGQRIELCRFGAVVEDAHAGEIHAGEAFQARLQPVDDLGMFSIKVVRFTRVLLQIVELCRRVSGPGLRHGVPGAERAVPAVALAVDQLPPAVVDRRAVALQNGDVAHGTIRLAEQDREDVHAVLTGTER